MAVASFRSPQLALGSCCTWQGVLPAHLLWSIDVPLCQCPGVEAAAPCLHGDGAWVCLSRCRHPHAAGSLHQATPSRHSLAAVQHKHLRGGVQREHTIHSAGGHTVVRSNSGRVRQQRSQGRGALHTNQQGGGWPHCAGTAAEDGLLQGPSEVQHPAQCPCHREGYGAHPQAGAQCVDLHRAHTGLQPVLA